MYSDIYKTANVITAPQMRIKIIAWKISSERTTPCPDIRFDVNSSRICSITFPTQSRYAFAELTRWMRPGERSDERDAARAPLATNRDARSKVRKMYSEVK